MKKTFAAFLFLFCACRLASQTAASVTMLTVNDGLSQGMVFDLLQSRDGFIWIATKDGLNRYDGSRFEVFSPDPFDPFAIGDSEIHSLFEDSRGWIWIGLSEGLDVFDPVSGRFFHGMHEGKLLPQIGYDGNFSEMPDGTIWFVNNGQVWKVSPPKDMLANAAKKGKSQIEIPCKPISLSAVSGWTGGPLEASHQLFTQEKKLLIGTNHGLFRLDPATEQIVHELPIPDLNIEWLAESKSGEVLIRGVKADDSEVWVLMLGGKVLYEKINPTAQFSNVFVFDDAGYLWVYGNRSIQKWRLAEFFNNGKPELEIPPSALRLENNGGFGYNSIMVDKSGIVWVGTTGFGIAKINGKGRKFKTAQAGTTHRFFYEDPNGAMYSRDLPDKKFLSKSFDRNVPNTDLPLSINNFKRYLTFDPAGNIWWLTNEDNASQIHRVDAATKTKASFPFEGSALIYDRNGKLVSIHSKGLHRFDPATKTSEHFPFEKPQKQLSEYSNFLYEDGEGVIWVFGFEGLTKATPSQAGYRYAQYQNDPADRNSLSINHVLSVCDDPVEPRRYLWMGTKGGGLNRLDKQSGAFKKYSTAQGLPDNVVYGVLAQDKAPYIWMSTNKGLCRFDVRAETAKNFTVLDGLQDNEFNAASYLKT